MAQYFAYDYRGAPFVQAGAAHIGMLLVLLSVAVVFWRWEHAGSTRKLARSLLAALLILNELGWHIWHAYHGLWSLQSLLPLNLCNLMVLASAWVLLTKNQIGYDFVYLLGIPAAAQVLITPALGIYGFPHFLFLQIFISHGGIVLAAIYLTRVEGLRPASWRSVQRVALWAGLYTAAIFCLNLALGSNYLFLAYKPPAATLLDYLGPWPWYILSMTAIGLALISLMYLPFHLISRKIPGSPASSRR